MPTASSSLHATAVALRALPLSSMIAAAKAAKKIASTEGTSAGSPIKGHKKKGLKLRATDDIRHQGNVTVCRIQGVATAAWVWRTHGTRPHTIRRRKKGAKSKLTVQHPGSRGTGAWDKVVARSVKVIPQIFSDDVTRVLR